MNSSTPTDICVKLGSDSYNVYKSKFLDLDVKFADVEGTNMFYVKSFVESYNKVNDEPIVEFYRFIENRDDNRYIPKYLERMAFFTKQQEKSSLRGSRSDTKHSKINHVLNSRVGVNTGKKNKKRKKEVSPSESLGNTPVLTDENGRWNIPNVIVYCYSQIGNTRGYWVCGELLSRYAQKGNIDFTIMVDKLIASIATFNEEKINEALKCLTLDNEKMNKRIEYFKKGCTKACNYMKEDVGHDYVAYVEWIGSKNAVYIGSMDKKKFMKERAKKNNDGTPARMFIYAKDNKFGIQLRDLYRECLRMLIGMNVKFDHNYIVFQDSVNMNGLQWKIRNCLQRVRAEATTPVL